MGEVINNQVSNRPEEEMTMAELMEMSDDMIKTP